MPTSKFLWYNRNFCEVDVKIAIFNDILHIRLKIDPISVTYGNARQKSISFQDVRSARVSSKTKNNYEWVKYICDRSRISFHPPQIWPNSGGGSHGSDFRFTTKKPVCMSILPYFTDWVKKWSVCTAHYMNVDIFKRCG